MSNAAIKTDSRHQVADHFDRLGRTGYWSGLYEEYADPRIRWSFVRRQARIEELLDDVAVTGARVVEIGPGSGNLVRYFAARHCRYRGFDTADAMVRQTADEIGRHYTYLCDAASLHGDIYQLPVENGSADIVIASGVFEYLDDPAAAARELARITRRPANGEDGGVAIITFPNARSLNRILGERLNVITAVWHGMKRIVGSDVGAPDVPRRPFATDDVRDVFEPAGWSLEAEAYYDIEVLPYPLKRLMPDAAFAAKRRTELAGRGPQSRLGNGFIARLRRC